MDDDVQCKYCNAIFRSSADLSLHKRIHTFSCEICSTEFMYKSLLSTHLRTHLKKSLKCTICSRNFSKSVQFNAHMKTHETVPCYKCGFCSLTFINANDMLFHIEEHQRTRYQCGLCSKGFELLNDLSEHLRLHFKIKTLGQHNKRPTAVSNSKGPLSDPTSVSTVTNIYRICDSNNDKNGDITTPSGDYTETAKRSAKVHQCEYCNATFKRKHLLTTHRRIHTGDRPYKCSYCDKNFSRYYAMVAHERLHTGERPYKCNQCDKSFTVSSHLNVHFKLKHIGLRPHKCDRCDKAYRSPGELRIHIRSHTGDRPFSCELCGKNYATQCSLTIHKKTHSPDKKPYICELCGLSYKQPSSLGVHMRTSHGGEEEKKHQCDSCPKRFHIAGSLLRHRRIHTGERPYLCDLCDKSFRESSALKTHKRRQHLGERPYCCDCCQKCFCTQTDLARHKKTHKGLAVLSSLAVSIAENELNVVPISQCLYSKDTEEIQLTTSQLPVTMSQQGVFPLSVSVTQQDTSPLAVPITSPVSSPLEEMYAVPQTPNEMSLCHDISLHPEETCEITASHAVQISEDLQDVSAEVTLPTVQDVTFSHDSMVVVTDQQETAIASMTLTLPVSSIHQTLP